MSIETRGYRPDVDGLRAIAVLLVVAYHAHLPGLPGGYLGVDMFFAISGYVITRLLLSEFGGTGLIDLKAFWRRRVARLWPALATVLLFVLGVTPLFVSRLSGELGPLAKAAMATVLLNANHFFLHESADYFAAASETNALLHMWSLSVEEQFYLLWPLALWLGLKYVSARALFAVVAAVALCSLILSVAWSVDHAARSFYLLPPRMWQLLAGAGIALLETRMREGPADVTKPGRIMLRWCALLMLFAAFIGVGRSWLQLPATGPIMAVAATAWLIWLGRSGGTDAITWALSSRVTVYVGRISYPLYLWHWPLLVMTRSHRLYEDSAWFDLLCVVVAVVLAVLTHELIEKRGQRYLRALPWRPLVLRWAGSAAVLVGLSLLLGAWTRFGWGYDERERWLDASRRDQSTAGCIFGEGFPDAEQEQRCFPRRWPDSVLLWGDSHGQHWSPAIALLAERATVNFAAFNLGGCRPLPRREPDWRCGEFYRRVSDRVPAWKDASGLRGVILAARWSEGTGTAPLSSADQAQALRSGYDDKAARSPDEALRLFESSLREQLRLLRDLGLRVLVILPTPNQRIAPAQCLSVKPDAECRTSRADNERYSGDVKRVMRSVIAQYDNARVFDAEPLLCDERFCPTVLNGTVVYSDDDHLSQTWTRSAAPALAADFDWLVSGPGRSR